MNLVLAAAIDHPNFCSTHPGHLANICIKVLFGHLGHCSEKNFESVIGFKTYDKRTFFFSQKRSRYGSSFRAPRVNSFANSALCAKIKWLCVSGHPIRTACLVRVFLGTGDDAPVAEACCKTTHGNHNNILFISHQKTSA